MSTTTTEPTTAPMIDPLLDPDLAEDTEYYERKFRENEAKKRSHIYDWIPQEPGLPGHTYCDQWLTFGKRITLVEVKCDECMNVMAERVGRGL